MDLNDAQEAIRTRQDLARFVLALLADLLHGEDEWENVTLDRYLGALSRWIADMGGYFKNQGIVPEPAQPDWALVGQMLYAATMYE